MKPPENIEKLIKNIDIDTNARMDKAVLDDVLKALENSKTKKPLRPAPNIRRIIMKSKITKFAFAAAAVVIVAVLIGVNMLKGTPAWAIDQTLDALKNIRSATATGEATIAGTNYDFKLYIKADPNKPYSFNGRVEADQIIGLIRDNIAYQYELGCYEIYAYDLEKSKGEGIGTKLWYQMMKNAPWIIPIAPTLLEASKLLASDWQEVYQKDEQTGRECVFVTGSYKPLSTSFRIVFDLETKLIVRAHYWTNASREGRSSLNVKNIVYNEEVSDEIFDLEKTTGAKVINEEETEKRWALWRQALDLERNKQFTEAIEVYKQIYEKYPHFRQTPEALCLIAILYRDTGQYDKAIEYFEKVPREYSAPRYAILDAYRLLGLCYMTVGQDDNALEAFQTCLKLIDQWDSEGRDWQKYRELVESDIEIIKSKK